MHDAAGNTRTASYESVCMPVDGCPWRLAGLHVGSKNPGVGVPRTTVDNNSISMHHKYNHTLASTRL